MFGGFVLRREISQDPYKDHFDGVGCVGPSKMAVSDSFAGKFWSTWKFGTPLAHLNEAKSVVGPQDSDRSNASYAAQKCAGLNRLNLPPR